MPGLGVLRYDAGASLLVEHGAEHRRFRGSSSGASRVLLAEVGRVNAWFRGDSELRLGVEGVLLHGPSRAAKAPIAPFSPQADPRTPAFDPADRGQLPARTVRGRKKLVVLRCEGRDDGG
jgi:hypothetical protein